jgi:hypothetical protein
VTVLHILAAAALALVQPTPQQAAGDPPRKPDPPVLNAKLGDCSADFLVKDAGGKPVYTALVHVRIRYGFAGVKRMDLEIGTDADGKARLEGLPAKARPLAYDISKGDRKAAAEQDLEKTCHATFDVTLK